MQTRDIKQWAALQEAYKEIADLRKQLGQTKGALANANLRNQRLVEEKRDLEDRLTYAIRDLAAKRRKAERKALKKQIQREQELEDLTGY